MGLLEMFGVPTGWLQENRGSLSGLGQGMVGARNWQEALKGGVQGAQGGQQRDSAYQTQQKAEQERQQQLATQQQQMNQTAQWLAAQGSTDLAEAINMGAMTGGDAFRAHYDRANKGGGEGFTLGEGQVRYGPNGEVIAAGPSAASKPPTASLQEYQFYAEGEMQAGRKPLSYLDYQRSLKGKGTSLSFDPTTGEFSFSEGGFGGPTDGRDPAAMGKQLSAADAELLKQVRAEAASAADLNSILPQMDYGSGKVGYTGPFGDLYGAVDDIVRVLPGDEGQRGAFRSNSTQAALTFVAKTKGAVSEKEMALFQQASPGLGNTPEGNKTLIAAMQAGANRKQTQAAFYDAYVAKKGSLSGVQGAWRKYVDENPIFVPDGRGGMRIAEEADPRPYLDAGSTMTGGQSGVIDYTTYFGK